MEEDLRRTSLAPHCVPLFSFLLTRDENRRAFGPGEGWDHVHCTVEPSPGHIRCREVAPLHKTSDSLEPFLASVLSVAA